MAPGAARAGTTEKVMRRPRELAFTSLRREMGADIAQTAGPDQPANDEPASDEAANDEPANDEPANDEPANDEPANDEPANDEAANDEAANDEAANKVKTSLPAMNAGRVGCFAQTPRCARRGPPPRKCLTPSGYRP